MKREPKSIVVTLTDLWQIQKAIKFNTHMLDARYNNMGPSINGTIRRYPSGATIHMHSAWHLREAVNGLIIRMEDEGLSQALLPLEYDEAWLLDWAFSCESYQSTGEVNSKNLLIQVLRVIWEHENQLPIGERAIGEPDLTEEKLASFKRQYDGDGAPA